MSGGKAGYLADKVVQGWAGGVAVGALPTNVYLALCTTIPTIASTGVTIVETNYTSYARTQIGTGNNQVDAWNAVVNHVVTNFGVITCPTATGASTNPIVGIGITDNASIATGNLLWWASVTSTAIASGDTPKVNAAAISITES